MSAGAGFTLCREGLPSWLERRHVAIPPATARACSGPEWRDAIVVLEYGSVTLVTGDGGRLPLAEGALFCLAGLGRATLRNDDDTMAMLSVARRCGAAEADAGLRVRQP